eukprot:gene1501-32879_t
MNRPDATLLTRPVATPVATWHHARRAATHDIKIRSTDVAAACRGCGRAFMLKKGDDVNPSTIFSKSQFAISLVELDGARTNCVEVMIFG